MQRIGMCLNNQQPLSLMRTVAQAAEAEGYEMFWVPEGIGAEAPTLIASLAGSTSTMKFGTGILPVYNRTPTLLMQLVLSMNQIMEGRFILGLGAGHAPDLWNHHGVKMERPFSRIRDCVHVVQETQRNNGRLSYEGRVVTVPNLHFTMPGQSTSPSQSPNTPMPKRPVPVYLAALGPKMAALAGEIADGVLYNMAPPEYLEESIRGVRDAARKAGRDPSKVDIQCLVNFGLGSSGEQFCRLRVARFLRLPFYQKLLSGCGYAADVDRVVSAMGPDFDLDKGAAVVGDRILESLAIVGDPETWGDQLARRTRAGVDVLCPYPYAHIPGASPEESILEDLRAMANAVK